MEENEMKFLPTADQWGAFYAQWKDALEWRLRGLGCPADREDAVMEAFQKVMGLSARWHVSSPLAPRTSAAWFGYLYWQAKGILSHRLAQDAYWQDSDTAEGRRSGRCAALQAELEGGRRVGVPEAELRLDGPAMSDLVRRFCLGRGFSLRNVNAFVDAVLEGRPTAAVVARYWRPADKAAAQAATASFYVTRGRILRCLREVVRTQQGDLPFAA